MSKKRRGYIPEITGEFATEDQILSRAREFFLIMVQTHTPKPLVALRDEVLPRYRTAFEAHKQQGKPNAEIAALAKHTFINAVLGDETRDFTLLKEFQEAQEATRGLYEASKALIDWSRTFNLRGKQTKIDQEADPRTVVSARKDSEWPLLAALQTIFHWHFAPAGWLWERRNPPPWRPPIHLFKDPPAAFESLPPIQLRSIAHWQPETTEQRAAIIALHNEAERRVIEVYRSGADDPASKVTEIADDLRRQMEVYPKTAEINALDWHVEVETEAQFRTRIQDGFNQWLNRHVSERGESARSRGLIEVLDPPQPHHFEWAAKHQVDKVSATRIADQCSKDLRLTPSGTTKAIETVLQTIRLEPRFGNRGPKRNPRPSGTPQAR